MHMVRAVRVCEGDITEEIKAANGQRLRTTTREGKTHMRQLADMLEASDAVMRHKVMTGKVCSEHTVQVEGHVGLDANCQ